MQCFSFLASGDFAAQCVHFAKALNWEPYSKRLGLARLSQTTLEKAENRMDEFSSP